MFLFNKSQIGIFITIALIIVGIFILLVFLNNDSNIEDIEETNSEIIFNNYDGDVKQVNDFVNNCLFDVSKEALYIVSDNGGYISVTGDLTYNESGSEEAFFERAYYNQRVYSNGYNGNENTLRDLDEVERVLKTYTLINLDKCISNFSFFERKGLEIYYENLTIDNVEIDFDFSQEKTIVKLIWDVSVESGESKATLSEFNSNVNLRFKKLYDISENIINDLSSNTEKLNINSRCQNYIDDEKINIYLKSNRNTHEYLVTIVDSSNSPNEIPFKFNIGIRNAELRGGCYGF